MPSEFINKRIVLNLERARGFRVIQVGIFPRCALESIKSE